MIVAGAGTGKTTVISQKIAHLISEQGVGPEHILAMTFTDKAAGEMDKRVSSLVDIGYADLHISTFHAFCQRLLEQYALDIGLPNRFRVLTQTDAWLLVRDHIYEFDLDYYRPLGNPGAHIHELIRHFSKCKDELITPDAYLAYAESVKLDNDDVHTDEKNRLTEVANAYHIYNQLLLKKSALDFGDLIFHAVRLLRERPALLADLKKKYTHILVDEFQDVNWSQYELVRMLTNKDSALTVVGDDDQSIYAFRGASVSNILRFKEDFPSAKEVVLNINYRSGQEILDAAYTLVQHNNPDRLEVKLRLPKALTSATESTSTVAHRHYPTLEEEIAGVVTKLCETKKQSSSAVWDDFAILVRANSYADPCMRALEGAGVPYEFLSSSGLYRQPIVMDCINFFKAIENHFDATALYRLMTMPALNMDAADVHAIVQSAKKKASSYFSILEHPQHYALSQDGTAKALLLHSCIIHGREAALKRNPTTVLYQFLDGSGYLSYLAREENQGNHAVLRSIYHLKQFFDSIQAFETAQPGATVHSLIEHLLYSMEAGDEGKLYQPDDTPDSVNILTIHGAKGLEFDHVFVVNMVEDRFPSRRRSDAIELPLALVNEQLPEGDYHYQEERRLCYVAMTRARKNLFLTSADDYGGVRKKKVSRFVVESGLQATNLGQQPKKSESLAVTRDQMPTDRGSSGVDHLYPLPKMFSFSQIRSYDTCPYQYKLAHVLKIPFRGSASFSFGNSIHNTLQHFYERVRQLNEAKQSSLFEATTTPSQTDEILVPELKELLTLYDEAWIGDWYESKRQKEDYYKKGKDILKIFYSTNESHWTIPIAIEGSFKIKVGPYTVTGKMDRVDATGDGLHIIDYKTGKGKEKVAGDDKDQLLMYQIAAQTLPQYAHHGTVSKLTFYYINDNIQTSFIGKSKELEKMQEKMKKVLDRIHTREFAPTPSQFVCARCDFRDICEFRK